jgi:GT2 family glycosyltransferase
LEYPSDRFEVIVVDDGNKAPLDRIVAPFCNRLNLILIRQLNYGPAAARNTGVARAHGKFLAFTDDDCRPSSHWLETLAARFAVKPDHMIGGRTLNALSDNIYSTTSQLMQETVYAYYNEDPNQEHFFASNNVAVPSDYFRTISGFDSTFPFACEDREFCDRWLHHGYQMTYATEVIVYHMHKLTFRKFLKQHFNYGRGAFLFQQARVQREWGRVKVDPKFYFHLFRYPFLQRGCRRVLLFETLLVASYMAYTAGFLWEKFNRSDGRSAGREQQ